MVSGATDEMGVSRIWKMAFWWVEHSSAFQNMCVMRHMTLFYVMQWTRTWTFDVCRLVLGVRFQCILENLEFCGLPCEGSLCGAECLELPRRSHATQLDAHGTFMFKFAASAYCVVNAGKQLGSFCLRTEESIGMCIDIFLHWQGQH